MAWKVIDGIRYFYRKVRSATVYCGPGERGEAAERECLALRAERERLLAEQATQREAARGLAFELDELATNARELAEGVIALAGAYRHQRGEWRRIDMSTSLKHELMWENVEAPPVGPLPKKSGTRKSEHPIPVPPRDRPSVQDALIQATYAKAILGDMPEPDASAFISAMQADAESLYLKLRGDSPSPVEDELAGVAVSCWWAMKLAERTHAATARAEIDSPKRRECRERILGHAIARYQNSLKQLENVRKLVPPGHPARQVQDTRDLSDILAILRARQNRKPPGKG